jgi:hypothetical protein
MGRLLVNWENVINTLTCESLIKIRQFDQGYAKQWHHSPARIMRFASSQRLFFKGANAGVWLGFIEDIGDGRSEGVSEGTEDMVGTVVAGTDIVLRRLSISYFKWENIKYCSLVLITHQPHRLNSQCVSPPFSCLRWPRNGDHYVLQT